MGQLHEGLILKGIGGFYYVEAAGTITECKARGVFRSRGLVPLAGDHVLFDSEQGLIGELLPRRNSFVRPPVANVDHFVLVVSTVLPKPDLLSIDKLTVIAASQGLRALIVLTKTDEQPAPEVERLYRAAGFEVIDCSAGTGGERELERRLADGVSVFAGNSGAGKSSLLNRMAGLGRRTQQASEHLGRGRHTTREVELFPFGGGYIVDTPGFSSIDLALTANVCADGLFGLFPDMVPYADGCYFADCTHTKEKGCAVLEALSQGRIEPSRHKNYCELLEQLKNRKSWQ